MSLGQVLTTFTYEHGIHDIQRLHSGEYRIRLRRNQPREIFRTHGVLASECSKRAYIRRRIGRCREKEKKRCNEE